MAQWLAGWAHNPKVRGSKPRSASSMAGYGLGMHDLGCHRSDNQNWEGAEFSPRKNLNIKASLPGLGCHTQTHNRIAKPPKVSNSVERAKEDLMLHHLRIELIIGSSA